MIKVSGGARDSEGAKAGLAYIDRQGQLPVEIDDGVVLQGRDVGDHLVADWQLDLCRSQYRRVPGEGETDTRDKLVHNLVLSMPAGTPGDAVLDAARGFARRNFAARHRYAMVLHTDQDNPHVHLVVKCEHETEGGQRLNIRKATLREWREQFAALMRDQGVEANATPRHSRQSLVCKSATTHTCAWPASWPTGSIRTRCGKRWRCTTWWRITASSCCPRRSPRAQPSRRRWPGVPVWQLAKGSAREASAEVFRVFELIGQRMQAGVVDARRDELGRRNEQDQSDQQDQQDQQEDAT